MAQRYGMGVLVWGPLGQGLLTGRVRKGQQSDLRRAPLLKALSDERRLDAVEQLVPLAQEAGLPMTHLAMAFATTHRGVTSALLGPRLVRRNASATTKALVSDPGLSDLSRWRAPIGALTTTLELP
jgi:aryl-alcohol dehydrogenase-like predicted oxidoreductase